MRKLNHVTLAHKPDTYNFERGDSFILDHGVWRLERWRDRLRFWFRRKLRLGLYSQVVAVDHARGSVSLQLVRWSWLRWKWVQA